VASDFTVARQYSQRENLRPVLKKTLFRNLQRPDLHKLARLRKMKKMI
jgi:hypothetical protein